MLRLVLLRLPLVLLAFAGAAVHAQSPSAPAPASPSAAAPDPVAILAKAKAASGGATWDRFKSQHTKVRITSGGRTANVERWVDVRTGRSNLVYEIAGAKGVQGYDGSHAWSREGNEPARPEISSVGRELATNAAYRDKLAFWFPDRARAKIEYKERASIGVNGYDVISITPEGGRPFDFWINRDTGLIERLVEPEAVETRTETYSDYRDVQGVKVPFRVQTTRSTDVRTDEFVTVSLLEWDVPIEGIEFAPGVLATSDFRFPEGRRSVTVPVEIHNGHVYLRAKLNGKGPFLLLFVPGGYNVVTPAVAEALQLSGQVSASGAGPVLTTIPKVEIGGLVLTDAHFVVSRAQSGASRAEGVTMDGMTGLELVKRFPMRLDYAASTLTVYDPDAFRYEGGAKALPLEFAGALPLVPGRIAGIGGQFGLDLGSASSVTLGEPFWQAKGLDQKLRAGADVAVDPAVDDTRARIARAPTLEVAGATIRDPVTLLASNRTGVWAEPGFAGTLGYGVLRRFAIVFDAPRYAIYLEPNKALGEPDPFDRAGLVLDIADNGFAIVEVLPGGPGEAAGIKAGDVIAALDGTPASSMPLSMARQMLRAAPGTKVRAKLASGREATIALRDIL